MDDIGDLPLNGITVLDLTHALAGPLATQRLGEMGAEVIKVESPTGDFSRKVFIGGLTDFEDSIAFVAMNRNKKSISIDLKKEEGKKAFYRLVEKADVLVQNYRPGVTERLQITFQQLKKINTRLVYVSISAYGPEGPLSDRPGQDLLLQSFCGLTMNGGSKNRPPIPSPLFMVDVSASHQATEAVLAGLYRVALTDKGLEANVTMISAIMEMQLQEITAFLAHKNEPRRIHYNSATIWMAPPYGIHKTSDGYLALAQCNLLYLSELIDSDELKEVAKKNPPLEESKLYAQWCDSVYSILEHSLMANSALYWEDYLSKRSVWCKRVLDYEEFLSHEQTQPYLSTMSHVKYGQYKTARPSIEFIDTREIELTSAPRFAQHSREVLLNKGFTNEEIQNLITNNVIYQK